MVKLGLAALAAATLCMTDEAQRSGAQGRGCENDLPPNATLPWLETDANTMLPNGAVARGLDVASVGWFVPPPVDLSIRSSNNVTPAFRSM
jgi:hypothetical protein